MQTITASQVKQTQVKQNSSVLQNALLSDMLITKRDKPFIVVVNYQKYTKLIKNTN
jgi:hypothetical protein